MSEAFNVFRNYLFLTQFAVFVEELNVIVDFVWAEKFLHHDDTFIFLLHINWFSAENSSPTPSLVLFFLFFFDFFLHLFFDFFNFLFFFNFFDF